MNVSPLVRHPFPHPTESLAGFIVRLSEANGYSTPRPLYQLAGMSGDEVSVTTLNLAKFAALIGHPLSCLQGLAFKNADDGSHTVRLLGKQVSAKELSLNAAKVCPSCVTELGFIEAHWHLDLMVACPVHERAAVWFCGKCRKTLKWARRGLLECACGNPLLTVPHEVYTAADYWLLDLIRRKALGIAASARSNQNVFEVHVAHAHLHSLLSLVRFVGNARLLAYRSKKAKFGRHVLKEAASVLAEWPNNFEILLNVLAPRTATSRPLVIGEHFEGLFAAVAESTALRFGRSN